LAEGSRQKRDAIFARIELIPPHCLIIRSRKQARGIGAAPVMPTASIEAMNEYMIKYLAEISQCVSVSGIALAYPRRYRLVRTIPGKAWPVANQLRHCRLPKWTGPRFHFSGHAAAGRMASDAPRRAFSAPAFPLPAKSAPVRVLHRPR
jgi:hypothetical protein